MSYMEALRAQLTFDEGERRLMYLDSRGIPTIGIGHNLRDRPISARAVQVIFEDDMAGAEQDARALVPVFDQLSDVRKAVVVNMAFNMGRDKFSQFKMTLGYINTGAYSKAADGMLASLWAQQVGARAIRLAEAMRKG